MPRFAASQERINRACIRHLADAGALLGGNPVEVLFDRAYIDVSAGQSDVASSTPMAKLLSNLVPANAVGMTLQITQGQGLGNWRVKASEPDGAGMTMLRLERTA